MRRWEMSRILWPILLLTLAGCGGSGDGSAQGSNDQTNDPADEQDNTEFATSEEFFASEVTPHMDFCRSCHTPTGIAGSDPDAERFMLSANATEDYANTRAAWEALGKGVESNLLLIEPTDPAEPHSGGKPWPEGSAPYTALKTIMQCWDNPDNCADLIGSGAVDELFPLLGDLEANGGRNYAAVHCEGKPDDEPLPMDPRELIAGENLNNPDYAVWYNDPFEICETEILFENQRQQNELLVSQGKEAVYSAKPRPQTCGEWRNAVEAGRVYILHNSITGDVLSRNGFYGLMTYLGIDLSDDLENVNANLQKMARERYGWPAHPYDNPFPMPGEDPNATNGGSLQLPIAAVQGKDDEGNWTGKIGLTCFACHIGQIGTGEVLGNSAYRDGHPELYGGSQDGTFVSVNGSNVDLGLAYYDIDRANGRFGEDSLNLVLNNPAYMANRTRGSNAADQEIVSVLLGRELDSLDWRNDLLRPEYLGKITPTIPATGGDQDMPTWWWTHNKSRYLWIGFGSSGSSRGNFFPASTNPYDGHWSKAREGDFQDLDLWLNAIEAPPYPPGYCSSEDGSPETADNPNCINHGLAEQGAVLFHSKDLWAEEGNADIPRPPGGNGSCAGCHGAYSPRYIHTEGYLADSRLAGMSGYTVPLEIIGTDPAQSNIGSVAGDAFNNSWFAYPDAKEDYVFPEEKSAFEESVEGTCRVGTLGGYTAQPLHGVWATAPYFHNASVPTIWDVLKPSDRPDVWLRQQVPEQEASPILGDRGFDTDMQRAYDYQKLGWNYERLSCESRVDATSMSCFWNENLPTFFDLFLSPVNIGSDYMAPPYVVSPGEGEVRNRSIYNTHAYSKGNEGHEFTKVLTDEERYALIEYLKTL